MGGVDGYTLRNGKHGANDWELVGSEKVRNKEFSKFLHVIQKKNVIYIFTGGTAVAA